MKTNLEKKLNRLNIAIVSHIFATGPALDLEEYLKKTAKSLLFIGHPFPYKKEINSFYRFYENGKLVKKHNAFAWKLPDILLYLKDAFYTLFYSFIHDQRFNYYIGSDGFDAFIGLLLKKLGKVDEVILFTIDFTKNRFKNPILNFLYYYFDKTCLENCKIIWNLSAKMAEGRDEYFQKKEGEFKPQIVVPLGIWFDRIPKLEFKDKERFRMVFMGHLIEKQGMDLVIESLPKIIKKIPKVQLVIIGTGAHEENLKKLTRKLKLEKYVKFLGYIQNHEDVEKEIAKSVLAIAMYKLDPESFTYFADPGKIKNYLAAGTPVILTNVPPIAKDIQKAECAIISDYKIDDFTKAVVDILSNEQKLKKYIKNSFQFAKKFDWNKIFSEALEKSI